MISGHPAFEQTDHRPWALPDGNWTWRQTWKDLLFIHWEIDEAEIRNAIPKDLEIDLYDRKAWIGIIPFDMTGVTLRNLPAPSLLSDFPEINVRTYVKHDGKPGVWFFSLDVPNPIAVLAARKFFHLPYYRARIDISIADKEIHYSHRRGDKVFEASYYPTGKKDFDSSSFEIWSTERYCLYSDNKKGDVFRVEVHHRKWPIESADIEIRKNTLLEDFNIGPQHPSVLFSKSIDVAVYSPKNIE